MIMLLSQLDSEFIRLIFQTLIFVLTGIGLGRFIHNWMYNLVKSESKLESEESKTN